jgi:RimJ/RimL family protein N-acetyltransferase
MFIALEQPSYEHLPWGPFKSVEEFMEKLYNIRIHPNVGQTVFAVYDKTKATETGDPDGALAGLMGYSNTNPAQLSTELAALISPRFQRSHVTSNAMGLLLHYALDLPSTGGLGLRRVEWRASPLNASSIKAAERMGFKKDGYFRWHWVLPDEKERGNGLSTRAGDPRERNLGRDTVVLSICWDDWEESVKGHVDAVMARKN